jgi:hypothetical protein
MVVVPLKRRAFGLAFLAQVVDVGFALPRRQQQVVARLLRREPAGNLAVEGGRLGLGQPTRLAVELGAIMAAVEVDGELAGGPRQLVVEADLGPLAGRAADRRAREAAGVGPELRLGPGQDLRLGLVDRDPNVRVGQLRRDRQRGPKRNRGLGLGRVSRKRQQTAALLPQRQQDGERTAAKDTEKGPAPETGRG